MKHVLSCHTCTEATQSLSQQTMMLDMLVCCFYDCCFVTVLKIVRAWLTIIRFCCVKVIVASKVHSSWSFSTCSERAERRKLKKMLISERRGAIRELRKDASYLGDQREAERRGDDKERKRDVRGNTAWLAKLEQDFRSGGQGGLWKKKRNK